MRPPPIRLITVDLDDTLWPSRPALEAAERAVYDWLCERAADLAARHDVASLRKHRLALRGERPDIAHDLTALRRESLARLLAGAGYAAGLADEGVAVFLDHRNRVRPYPDASPGLRCLGERYCLVSVTNGNADVERTPLRGHFHHALRAEDVGAAKPDPAMFAAAVDLADTVPCRSLHVGDDPLLDVAAARRYGMHAAWMDRGGGAWPEGRAAPEARVTDLFQLIDWLDAWA